MERIKLLLVDDSEIHLEGLKVILNPCEKFEILGEAYTVSEAKDLLQRQKPDVILLDISLEEEEDGIELAKYLHKLYPKVAVIILSHYKEARFIIGALKAQVRAYLAKDTKSDELIHAIESVVRGKGVFFGDTISYNYLLNILGDEKYLESGKPYGLSNQEIRVIELLAEGNSSKLIADELHIDKSTVESYKERIKNKLGCNTVIEIVISAIRKKIITV